MNTAVTRKTKAMLRAEERLGQPLEKILPETYEKYGNLEEAGKALGILPPTLYMWLLRLGYVRKVILVQGNGTGAGVGEERE